MVLTVQYCTSLLLHCKEQYKVLIVLGRTRDFVINYWGPLGDDTENNLRSWNMELPTTTKRKNAMSGFEMGWSFSCSVTFPRGTFPRFVTLPEYLSVRLRILRGAGCSVWVCVWNVEIKRWILLLLCNSVGSDRVWYVLKIEWVFW